MRTGLLVAGLLAVVLIGVGVYKLLDTKPKTVQVVEKYNESCEEMVLAKHAKAMENVDAAFKNGNIVEGFDTPEAFYKDLRLKAVQQKEEGLKACYPNGMPPMNSK